MSDLGKIGDLLALHGAGVLEVNYVGGSAWMRAARAYRLLPPLEQLCWEREPMVTAMPLRRAGRYLERVDSSLLWVRTTSGAAAGKLRSFRPAPDVLLREGSDARYVGFWALERPLDREWLERANARLAKFFNAGNYGDAKADFSFYLPGAIIRHGRARSTPVELVRFEVPDKLHTAREVVGKLKDPPTEEEKLEYARRAKDRREAEKAQPKP